MQQLKSMFGIIVHEENKEFDVHCKGVLSCWTKHSQIGFTSELYSCWTTPQAIFLFSWIMSS